MAIDHHVNRTTDRHFNNQTFPTCKKAAKKCFTNRRGLAFFGVSKLKQTDLDNKSLLSYEHMAMLNPLQWVVKVFKKRDQRITTIGCDGILPRWFNFVRSKTCFNLQTKHLCNEI